ncbi:MAG: extracellular solute-binding protein, partial [Acidobacteriota bacterium]|nr:extracellular solute-binding protein [Acidobacteriota bacterium]
IITLFDAGRLGMIRYGRWGLIVWRKNPKLRIGVCPLPYRKQKATTFVTRISVLNKKSPYKREAFNFMKFLASEDYGNQINDSADNLAPVKRLCYLDRFLHNPQYPQEDYNEVFRDEMACAKSVELSKFSNPFVVDRIFRRYIDLMRNKEMTAVDAMTAAAKEINESIEENVAKFPELQAEYDKLTGSH